MSESGKNENGRGWATRTPPCGPRPAALHVARACVFIACELGRGVGGRDHTDKHERDQPDPFFLPHSDPHPADLTHAAAAAAAVAADLDARLCAARSAAAKADAPPGAGDTVSLLELAAAEARRRAAAAAAAAVAAGTPPPPAGGWHPPGTAGSPVEAVVDDGVAALAALAAGASGADHPVSPGSADSIGSNTSSGRPVHCVIEPAAAAAAARSGLPSLGASEGGDGGEASAAVRTALAGLMLDGYGVSAPSGDGAGEGEGGGDAVLSDGDSEPAAPPPLPDTFDVSDLAVPDVSALAAAALAGAPAPLPVSPSEAAAAAAAPLPPALAALFAGAPPAGWPTTVSAPAAPPSATLAPSATDVTPSPLALPLGAPVLGAHDYHCPVCSVTCCGHANFEQHCVSRRHLRKVAAVASAALASAGGAPPPPPAPRAAARPYVRQVITPDLNRAAVDLLSRLLAWQDAARGPAGLSPIEAPPPPLAPGRRLVSGLRDIARCVRAGVAVAVIVAPNVEPAPADGGDDLLAAVLSASVSARAPIVFALSRKKLGQVFGVRKKMSAVAVVDAAGAEDVLARVLALAAAGRAEWARLEAQGGAPLPGGPPFAPPPPPRHEHHHQHALYAGGSGGGYLGGRPSNRPLSGPRGPPHAGLAPPPPMVPPLPPHVVRQQQQQAPYGGLPPHY